METLLNTRMNKAFEVLVFARAAVLVHSTNHGPGTKRYVMGAGAW